MFKVTPEMAKEQVATITKLSKQSSILYFDPFIDCLAPLYNIEEMPDEVRIPKPIPDLLRGDFEPARIIDLRPYKEDLYYGKMPMWCNKSNKEFSLHGFGLIDNNKSKPSLYSLFDTSPHMFEGGATGHGKSVTLNDMIITGALVHPPWKVQYYLNDPKVVELKPYAMYKHILPHVNTVAATEDPNYTISMLKYVISIMEQRNKIFTKAQVPNIDAFQKNLGLEMPMLVLVLDECRSMYLKAAKLATMIDYLIELFVALARNAGGRCIMASQQVVEEMAKGTMANVNIRACLGCNPTVSTAVIGNVGASINLGKKGKITVNTKPGDGKITDNSYLVTPFLPTESTPESQSMYQIFDFIYEKWSQIYGEGERLEPLSFFDDEAILDRDTFLPYIRKHASLSNFFIGEPAFIYKEQYEYFNFSLTPTSDYDTLQDMNILCMSPIAEMRFTMLALVLANLETIGKKRDISIQLYSTIKDIQDKVVSLGFRLDKYDYSMEMEMWFGARMKAILYRMTLCTADEKVFTNRVPEESEVMAELFEVEEMAHVTGIMKKRMIAILTIMQESKNQMLLSLNPLNKNTINDYVSYLIGFEAMYKQTGCLSKQIMPAAFPVLFHVFMEFDQLKGVEVKTQMNLLEQWFSVIRLGPNFGVYTILVCGPLPNAGVYVAPAFSHLLLYGLKGAQINPFKIADEYPDSIGKILFVYVNKKLPSDYCFKIKYPRLLGVVEKDKEG